MTNLEKVAGEVPGVLNAAAQHMRKMAATNADMAQELAGTKAELQIMKLARRMEQRGLEPNLSFEEKVASLQQLDPTKLASLEYAVEISPGGFRLGHVSQEETTQKVASGERYNRSTEGDDLDNFVMSNIAYGG